MSILQGSVENMHAVDGISTSTSTSLPTTMNGVLEPTDGHGSEVLSHDPVGTNDCGSGVGVGVSINIIDESNTSVSSIDGVHAHSPNDLSPSPSALPFIVKTPRANSKLILQNMEEVLNTVRKKHRLKHKRKREQRKLAMLEAEGNKDAKFSPDLSSEDCNVSRREKFERRHQKKPLQEKTAESNGVQPQEHHRSVTSKGDKTSSPSGTLLQHFQRTPKKSEMETQNGQKQERQPTHATPSSDAAADSDAITTTTPQAKRPPQNVFEMMMNARSKTIGSNTPGKEATEEAASGDSASRSTKRKLMLQEWAEKKGAAKRRLEDEARGLYIEDQLENRAKRLKRMLVSGRKGASSENGAGIAVSNSNGKKPRGRPLKNAVSAALATTTTTPAEKGGRNKRKPRKRRTDSNASTTDIVKIEDEKSNQVEAVEIGVIDVEANEELKKSSAPVPRSRRSAAEKPADNSAVDVVAPEAPLILAAVAMTPSGRPKRSCSSKIRYDYDLEKSPTKPLTKTPQKSPRTRKVSERIIPTGEAEQAEEDDQSFSVDAIVLLDDSSCQGLTPKKLAPLFVRSLPKPSPDPGVVMARREFLRSGVPEKIRLEQERNRQYEQNFEELHELFPTVSHVQQLSPEEKERCCASPAKIPMKVKLLPRAEEEADELNAGLTATTVSSRRKLRGKSSTGHCSLTTCSTRDFRQSPPVSKPFPLLTLPLLENKREIIKMWKAKFDSFPTYKCYNQLRTKYHYFSAIDAGQSTEQVSESLVVTRRMDRQKLGIDSGSEATGDNMQPPAAAPNGELLFTEKYKPMLYDQVLVNLAPVSQLRDFLSNWSLLSTPRNSQISSLDDSMDYQNDSSSSSHVACNTIVLLGPVSCGKTNAVSTLANEMNFNVLEVNAGMKRTGKKLIQELQEATQSHQVRKKSSTIQGQGQAQKNLLKMSLSSLKGKKLAGHSKAVSDADSDSARPSTTSPVELSSSSVRKSLILLEDADIVFEQTDAGFIDAIFTLAASSKRPVIIVANNPKCPHLQRLINQNHIKFPPANILNISKFLSIVSLLENCPINLDDIISLYLYNRCDIRRTLLEMQFFIQSGGDRQRASTVVSQGAGSAVSVAKDGNSSGKGVSGSAQTSTRYFVSPNKSDRGGDSKTEIIANGESDDQVLSGANHKLGENNNNSNNNNYNNNNNKNQNNASPIVHIHHTLFDFFTTDQNSHSLIPYPVDFYLLRNNLNDLLRSSRKLKRIQADSQTKSTQGSAAAAAAAAKFRKSRSPKKAWLSSATQNGVDAAVGNRSADAGAAAAAAHVNHGDMAALSELSAVYANISVATLLGSRSGQPATCNGSQCPPTSYPDRTLPDMAEEMAHFIAENVMQHQLEVDMNSYNLFDVTVNNSSICDKINNGSMTLRSRRERALDYEPALRSICRSEQQRSLSERRSTRFYHYLRYYSPDACNFSTAHFDNACKIFQDHPLPSSGECDERDSG